MATRKVGANGKISFAAQPYPVGVWLAGETVEVAVDAGLVTTSYRGVVVATRAAPQPRQRTRGAAAQTPHPMRPEAASADRRPDRDPQSRLGRLRVLRRG